MNPNIRAYQTVEAGVISETLLVLAGTLAIVFGIIALVTFLFKDIKNSTRQILAQVFGSLSVFMVLIYIFISPIIATIVFDERNENVPYMTLDKFQNYYGIYVLFIPISFVILLGASVYHYNISIDPRAQYLMKVKK